ncbi:MAG: AsmA-like C-terminal domain-containing protein [Nitrospirae bacterium]|nr:AsmA-like C-terminal domain-containing protein [Nitrospirota bacterium]
MSRLRLGLVIVLALVVFAIAFLSFSKDLTGQDYLKDFVLQQLEESLGRKIEVHRVKFVLFPRIRVELSQVSIHDPNSDQVVLTAKKVDLVLRLLPLLRKQVVGKRLLIEEPTLTLRRNETGHWNVLDGLKDQETTDQRTMDLMARTFMIRQATLVNGTITVIDAARPDGIRSIKLEHVEFGLLIRPDRGLAELHFSAAHPGEQGVSAVSLDGVVRRLEKSVSLSSEDSAGPAAVFQFDGHIDAADLKVREVADFLGPRPISEHLQGALNLQSSVRVMPGVAGYDMVLSDMTARLNEMTLTGKANLAGLLTPQPTFAVTFSSSLVALPQLLKTIPVEWINPQLSTLLADRQIDGKVQVMNATLTGSATAGPQLSTTGEFHVQEGKGLIGRDRVAAKDLAAVVFVEAGRVRVASVTGIYGGIQITDGKATVSFLEAGPWLELEITGNMAASHLLEFLAKTMKAERFTRLLAGIRDVEGMAQPTFRLVGPLNQSDGVTFAGGEITARHVSLNHIALPERLMGMQGRFILADGSTQLDQVTGYLGDTVLQVQGTMTGGTTGLFQDFVVRARGDAARMTRLIPLTAIPQGTFEGILSAVVALSGSTATPHVRGAVVFDESKVALPGFVEKPVGAPVTVEFEGDVAKANTLTMNRVELILPSMRIPAKGVIQFGDRFTIDAAVATGTLSLSSLPEWISKGGFEAGNLEVSLDVKGKEPDWKGWRITGWMALTNGLMLAKGVEGHIQDLYARVKLVRNGAEVKRLSFKTQDSDVSLEATIRNWMAKPVITGKIESNQLDLDLLIPKGERSPMREFLETLAATSQVTMSAAVERGHYKHMKFGGLSARLNIQDGVLDVDRISGESTNGQVAGRIVVQLPRKAPADIELSLRATGVQVEDLLKLTNTRVHGVSGEMRLSGSIRGHGRNPHGIYPSLNGKAEVLLENGRILRSRERAVWKIISLLNLPAVLQGKVDLEKEGLPYNKIAGTMVIQNGLFQTENLIIDSPILKITAAGNYDLPTDQLDLVVAVSPFGSYSQFLKTIPLFGRILAGDRKGLATAMFAVKGAVEDPEVTYLPMKSFASGLSGLAQLAVDVLTNTLTLPLDLVTPDEENRAKPEGMPAPEPVPATP